MAKQTINIGTSANDGTGDPLRIAFDKANDNFDELYAAIVTTTSDLTNDSGFITANSIPTAVSSFTNDAGYITANTGHIVLNTRYTLGTAVTFSNQANTALVDVIGPGLTIARDPVAGGIYNVEAESGYDLVERDSPVGTRWNYEGNGFGNLDNVKNRYYTTFAEALKHAIGRNIIGANMIMHDTINDKYYTVVFSHWGIQGAGTFAYTRTEIVPTTIGVTFPDGSYQPSAWTGYLNRYNRVYVGPYSGHELSAAEAGSVIYFYNTHIVLPNNIENNCPIGSFYTLVIGDVAGSLRVKKYVDTTTIPAIESPITALTNVGPFNDTEYPLEPFSIAHLIKIEKNGWSLVPTGIQTSLTGSVFSANNALLVDANTASFTYDPADPTDWANTAPTTVGEALDRIAAAIKVINGTGA